MIAAGPVPAMKKLRFLLSLTNDDNDYQIEQTAAAQQAARNDQALQFHSSLFVLSLIGESDSKTFD